MAHKWLSELQKIAFIADDDNGTIVLSFDHLQAAFVLLSIGLSTSFIIFVIEMIGNRERFKFNWK